MFLSQPIQVKPMPKLDARLKTVATLIRANVHVDVGSDHGHLLKALLTAGRIRRGIAIENKTTPLNHSRRTLDRLPADVRLGDGLDVLRDGEADSVSVCGMGGRSIVTIFDAHPDRVPDWVVTQPNRDAESIRRWALRAGFHLVEETQTTGRRSFDILQFCRSPGQPDPAYEHVDQETALAIGPRMMMRRDESWLRRLENEQRYWERLPQCGPSSHRRWRLIRDFLQTIR